QHIAHTVPLIMQWDETFDIGADTGTPIANDYQPPFNFTGKLARLTLSIDRPKLTPEDEKKLRQTNQLNRASE
ncbi:MAG: arylsulfatase, partial [Polyangia bacterium]